jgi:hypothetical protein
MLDADEAGGLFNNVEQLEGDVKALAWTSHAVGWQAMWQWCLPSNGQQTSRGNGERW